jgi:hypothetical protein
MLYAATRGAGSSPSYAKKVLVSEYAKKGASLLPSPYLALQF